MRAETRTDRGGFAMAAVVFLLFAIAVAGATGYQIVQLEARLATENRDGNAALEVATAGIHRFVGASYGIPDDSVLYYIGEGRAAVVTRRVARVDSVTDVYLLTSTGYVDHPLHPGVPATRTVRQYARLHKDPVAMKSALMVAASNVYVTNSYFGGSGLVTGTDYGAGACSSTSTVAKAGVAGLGTGGSGAVYGSPARQSLGSLEALLDSARVRWDIVFDPNFEMIDTATMSAVPADSFPVIRHQGDRNLGSSDSGRGIMIVTGRVGFMSGFIWRGVILAGSIASGDYYVGGGSITGMVLAGPYQSSLTLRGTNIRFDYCDALDAMRSLAYLELLEATWWEETA